MTAQPEQDPKRFSPEFEESIQRQERITARKNGPRKRVRTKPCCIPECVTKVNRSNKFDLCLNHMLLVWTHVEGKHFDRFDWWEVEDSTWSKSRTPVSDELLTIEERELRAAAKREQARRSSSKRGHLYVMDTQSGLVKIGWSGHLDRRMAQYPPTFDQIVSVPGTRGDERDVHRSLKHARGMGREWYYLTPEVVRQINQWIVQANIKRQQAHSDRSGDWVESDLGPIPPAFLIPRFTPTDRHITEAPQGKPAPQTWHGSYQIR